MNNEVRKTKEEGSVYYGVYALEGPRAHFGGWGRRTRMNAYRVAFANKVIVFTVDSDRRRNDGHLVFCGSSRHCWQRLID